MERLPAQRRPHYPPMERLAILELRSARGWSAAETVRRLLVTPLTVASWTSRLDEEGPDALVQFREPVNRFPDFVGYLVRRLKVLCPTMGTRRIASVLARAGLHLDATTVRRMLEPKPRPAPAAIRNIPPRVVTAKRPNHVWHLDLSTVPIGFAFWIPWLPLSLPQRWPFCWWIAVVVDHDSRRVMGLAVFLKEPTAADVTRFLERICKAAGARPAHLISDHGTQFTAAGFAAWCHRRGIQQRFGAIGKYGSLAVAERCIRSLKHECTRAILVPFHRDAFQRELDGYAAWFNAERPLSFLAGGHPGRDLLREDARVPQDEIRATVAVAAAIRLCSTAGARSRAARCRARALRRSSRRSEAPARRDPSPRRVAPRSNRRVWSPHATDVWSRSRS